MKVVDAFILAGGHSSRMGRDKALIELCGETLAARAVRIAAAGLRGSRVTIVAGRAGQFGVGVFPDDITVICDQVTGRGPIGGIHTALEDANSEWIFVLACDYPFITPEFISLLADKIDAAFDAVVPEQPDGRLQPLCAFYRRSAAVSVAADLLGPSGKMPPMRELVHGLSPRIVRPEEYCGLPGFDAFFCNINTAADLAEAENFANKPSP